MERGGRWARLTAVVGSTRRRRTAPAQLFALRLCSGGIELRLAIVPGALFQSSFSVCLRRYSKGSRRTWTRGSLPPRPYPLLHFVLSHIALEIPLDRRPLGAAVSEPFKRLYFKSQHTWTGRDGGPPTTSGSVWSGGVRGGAGGRLPPFWSSVGTRRFSLLLCPGWLVCLPAHTRPSTAGRT